LSTVGPSATGEHEMGVHVGFDTEHRANAAVLLVVEVDVTHTDDLVVDRSLLHFEPDRIDQQIGLGLDAIEDWVSR
jgi:hypothetical protein